MISRSGFKTSDRIGGPAQAGKKHSINKSMWAFLSGLQRNHRALVELLRETFE